MDKWQQYTMRANTEFRLRCYGNAILMHNQALDSARLDFDEVAEQSVDRAISRVVISHFHLAECYAALEEVDRASDFYLWAQSFLLELIQSESASRMLCAVQAAQDQVDCMWHSFLGKHRENITYERMVQYHEKVLQFDKLEADQRVCH